MSNNKTAMTLERYAQEYENDPEFIAEGLSIKVIEEMLDRLEQKKLSQSWLAQQMGVSRAHISRILNAPPNMTLLTLAKIAVALGVRPDVCLNAESRRISLAVPSVADAMVAERSGEVYLSETKLVTGTVRQDRLSTAEAALISAERTDDKTIGSKGERAVKSQGVAMQNNKDDMDELFKRISQFLAVPRFESDMIKVTEALLESLGRQPLVGQGILWLFFEQIEGITWVPIFTVSDGCAFCGYNENPKVLRFRSFIPRNWQKRFPDKLSSQTPPLCPTCRAELYLQMRQELGTKVTAKELILFLSYYSYKKAWKP
ncbi:MAG: helix-turn-helix transcriptional regulator [Bdellovibrionota bacterium]